MTSVKFQNSMDDPGVGKDLETLGVPSMWSLLGELVLYDNSFRQALSLLPSLTGLRQDFVSTDLRPYLEYQVPGGNYSALQYG